MIIKRLIPDWAPLFVNCDFEAGLRNSIREVYPDSKLILCLFHLYGCMSRNMSRFNIKNDLMWPKGVFYRFWMKLRGMCFLDLSQPLIRSAVIYTFRHEIQNYRKSLDWILNWNLKWNFWSHYWKETHAFKKLQAWSNISKIISCVISWDLQREFGPKCGLHRSGMKSETKLLSSLHAHPSKYIQRFRRNYLQQGGLWNRVSLFYTQLWKQKSVIAET